MAKGFPYFKFVATEWLTGDIVFEDFELQGIFINICALYWHRDGKITIDEIQKRLKTERIAELTDRFFSVSDGFICINFLDEQLVAANHISKTNSDNGKLGGRPKAAKTLEKKPTALDSLTETKAKKSKEEEEREEEVKKIKSIYDTLVAEHGNDIKLISEFIKTNKPKFISPYIQLWNLFSQKYGVVKVEKASKTRESKIRVRLNEENFDFVQILKSAAKQKFALESRWFTFDWIIQNDTNYLKVLENKYTHQESAKQEDSTALSAPKE